MADQAIDERLTFTITQTHTFDIGYGVVVTPVHDLDDDGQDRGIADVDVEVVRLDEDTTGIFGGVPCWIDRERRYGVPLSLFLQEVEAVHDDTHDLRSRWFATEGEAREHASYTIERWTNPRPWESFVVVS